TQAGMHPAWAVGRASEVHTRPCARGRLPGLARAATIGDFAPRPAGAHRSRSGMKPLLRALAALSIAAAAFAVTGAFAQDRQPLSTDRDKASYMVGMDVARSLAPAAEDVDLAA